jgi:hypothetical protein
MNYGRHEGQWGRELNKERNKAGRRENIETKEEKLIKTEKLKIEAIRDSE